ncbi:MAG: hypothetical protein CVU17_00645 [Betaproteobacteria bacterium HGW-Betaproteobacteria-11]|nr:MAG: hypothetical protein CVU17_00645 [Betaproteobacteria bacterium HGW-Betaproteobacteria-11]
MARLNRREFQQNLATRLTQAERGEIGRSLLAVESGADDLPGGRRWLIDLSASGEVVPLPPLTPAPLTQPWFAGVANIRGALYSVVDFSAWRGGASTPRNAQARLLLIGARHGSNSALLVERALGLRAREQLASRPKTAQGGLSAGDSGATLEEYPAEDATSWLGESLADNEGMLHTVLDASALLSTRRFLDIVC